MNAAPTHLLPYDPATVEFDPLLRRLNLANTRRRWRELLDRAETHDWSCREFLGVLITEEISHRQQTRIQRSVRQARFPFLKTVEEFDFSFQSSVRRPSLGSYLGPELVSGRRNLILQGKSGRGKTHLVVAIAYRAIQNGFTARFVTAAVLIESLSVASRQGKLQEQLAHYLQPHVLVIDEVGYLSYGPDAANVLFHIVNERHQRGRPMLFTTNKPPLTAWGDVLHDHDLAEAIVDRVLENGRLLLLDGPSYRTRHLDLPAEDTHDGLHQPARISGNQSAEFPEPTKGMGRETVGQWHPIRLWHYFGQFRRFEGRNRRKQAAITKTRFKFGSNASLPVKLRLAPQNRRPGAPLLAHPVRKPRSLSQSDRLLCPQARSETRCRARRRRRTHQWRALGRAASRRSAWGSINGAAVAGTNSARVNCSAEVSLADYPTRGIPTGG